MDFRSAYAQGFVRVAACTLPTVIGDPQANAAAALALAADLHRQGVGLAVLPELCLSGYSLEDVLLQDTLLSAVLTAVEQVVAGSVGLTPVLVLGAPLRHRHRVYNTALVVHDGQILGVVPKSYLPLYREFYEARQLASGVDEQGGSIVLGGRTVPFGTDLLFAADDLPGFVLHVEICEDLWVPVPPSALGALAGATVLANLSGSPVTVGRAQERELLCRSASARCLAAHVYAAAGPGESSTDLAWDGQTLVHENGVLLAQGERFAAGPVAAVADVDLYLLRAERTRMGSFDDNRRQHSRDVRTVPFTLAPPAGDLGLRRTVQRFPFVPSDPDQLAQDCYEAYHIQVAGLQQRLASIGHPKVLLGLSGGLDSTQALIVAARALDRAGRPRTDILAFTMPGFATSEHTRANATALAKAVGVTFAELDIRPAARQMLADLKHPFARGEAVYDVTFENVQAGLRTDYLFRAANQRGGIVLGTGDLSELALGWSTYGVGDQMSHYTVNSGVPKTLVQHLIRWVIGTGEFGAEASGVLQAILDTEISPELVPVAQGAKPQSTQDTIGPYALHDFFLFHVLRHGLSPSRVAFLAEHAWADPTAGSWPTGFPHDERVGYDLPVIRHWLEVFCRRFYGFSQFKRSALPNGPKVSSGGSLSPRGDWRAPSDLPATIWLADLARVPQEAPGR